MRKLALGLPLLLATFSGCSMLEEGTGEDSSEVNACGTALAASFRFPSGGDGHADPYGAAKAKQARAGKLTSTAQIIQPPDPRHRVRPGDFVLANEKVAVYIEAEGRSDGYMPYGGEILGIEPIGPDGRPLGVSYFGEQALMFSLQTVSPEKVSVIADGSDGGPAIVRASGVMKSIPVLDVFVALFPEVYDLPVAIDYVLEPGASKVTLRINIANTKAKDVSFADRQHVGVFQQSRSQVFTETNGFSGPSGVVPYVAWDNGPSSFLLKSTKGPFEVFLETSGLEVYKSPPLAVAGCQKTSVDYLEVTAGGPGLDGLLEQKRATYGEEAWRAVTGVVREAGGGPIPGAIVHATSGKGYLTRTTADARGAFTIHVPAGQVDLTPTVKGWGVPAGTAIAEGAASVELTLPKRATIEVEATDADSHEAVPVRVQIVPETPAAKAPPTFGIKEEPDDRLYREYAMNGKVSVPVPPGGHRVIVTRGYEYEVHDVSVVAAEGKTVKIAAPLKHSVDSTGVMCADFHIHSIYSADSSDPVEKKVRGALADGLEIPISSEHEFVIDFQPTIEKLGLSKWAFGMASEEMTTFGWGHFGVFPLTPSSEAPNNGAVDWAWKKPPQLFPEITSRPEQPMIIVNHPRGDSGYFELSGFDAKTASGTIKELWSEEYQAVEVWNDADFDSTRDTIVADWFSLINAGKYRPGLGSSDSHELSAVPVGYPRTCMRFGHDDPRQLKVKTVRDTVRAGAAVISGGITMTVAGPGGILPGGTATAGTYDVVVASPSWVTPTQLEVIVDGITTQTIDLDPAVAGPGPGRRWQVPVNVQPGSSREKHWVVFHARGQGDLSPLHPMRKPFAVSNPIFF